MSKARGAGKYQCEKSKKNSRWEAFACSLKKSTLSMQAGQFPRHQARRPRAVHRPQEYDDAHLNEPSALTYTAGIFAIHIYITDLFGISLHLLNRPRPPPQSNIVANLASSGVKSWLLGRPLSLQRSNSAAFTISWTKDDFQHSLY